MAVSFQCMTKFTTNKKKKKKRNRLTGLEDKHDYHKEEGERDRLRAWD